MTLIRAAGIAISSTPAKSGFVMMGVGVAVAVPVVATVEVAVGVNAGVDVAVLVGVPLGDGQPVPPVARRAIEKLPCDPELPV